MQTLLHLFSPLSFLFVPSTSHTEEDGFLGNDGDTGRPKRGCRAGSGRGKPEQSQHTKTSFIHSPTDLLPVNPGCKRLRTWHGPTLDTDWAEGRQELFWAARKASWRKRSAVSVKNRVRHTGATLIFPSAVIECMNFMWLL